MQPLARMPHAILARLEGVVFDVDDTVTRDGRLERVAFDAMWRLHEAGLRLGAVTGRPLGWCDVLARMWPVDVAVGENGAGWVWVDADHRLRHGYFADADTRQEQARCLERVRERVARELPSVAPTADLPARRCEVAFDVGEAARLDRATVDRLVACIEAEGARSMVSTVHAHAIPGAWDKAQGVARAAREVLELDLAANRDRWVFIGDSGNDAAAFAWFEHTVGVANVRGSLDRLSTHPVWVTEADRGGGFAELADRIVHAR
ncbi:MAG: HAD-IIB family hydrolase [Myxococcota bacterium]